MARDPLLNSARHTVGKAVSSAWGSFKAEEHRANQRMSSQLRNQSGYARSHGRPANVWADWADATGLSQAAGAAKNAAVSAVHTAKAAPMGPPAPVSRAAPHDPPRLPDYGPHGGNIDLNDRPRVHNPNGGTSTVFSQTITQDGKAYVIPRVLGSRTKKNGRLVSADEATRHFVRTGQHLGVFKTETEAGRYSQALHLSQAAQLGR